MKIRTTGLFTLAMGLIVGLFSGVTSAQQQETVEWLVPLLLAKQCVQAIVWNQLHDGTAHAFPHGGLFDAQGHPKPALDVLTEVRKTHLA